MNQSIKIFAAAAMFCIAPFLTLQASAQETTFEFKKLDSVTEPASVKPKFTVEKNVENKSADALKREFTNVKRFVPAEKNPALPQQQQTYVRPSKDARVKRYLSDAFGVPALIGATFGATVLQIGNNPPEWEKNIGGFGKRFASSYGTNAIRNTVSFGISEAFKLDNRFEKSGQKNFGKRLKHVFVSSYTTRTKNGKRIPDFPHFVGTYSAAVIANETWYPNRYSYKDGLRDGTISLGVRFGVNLLREFIFPK